MANHQRFRLYLFFVVVPLFTTIRRFISRSVCVCVSMFVFACCRLYTQRGVILYPTNGTIKCYKTNVSTYQDHKYACYPWTWIFEIFVPFVPFVVFGKFEQYKYHAFQINWMHFLPRHNWLNVVVVNNSTLDVVCPMHNYSSFSMEIVFYFKCRLIRFYHCSTKFHFQLGKRTIVTKKWPFDWRIPDIIWYWAILYQ